MTTVSERLRNVHRVYRGRGDSASAQEVAYWVYAGILALLLTGFPLVRSVVLFLAQESSLRVLVGSPMPDVVANVAAFSTLTFVLLGAVRGPALLSPFFVYAISGSDVPRSRGLLRPFVISSAIVISATTALAGLITGVLVVGTAGSLAQWISFGVGALFLSILTCMGWLLGQVVGRRLWLAALSIVALIVVPRFFPQAAAISPWHWLGALWPGAQGSALWVIPLVLVATSSMLFTRRLLNSASNTHLLRQANQWQSATTSALAGDAGAAFGAFRAAPRVGRRWVAIRHHSIVFRFLRRDVVGAFRTPTRMVACLLSLTLACSIVGAAHSGIVEPWILGMTAGLLGFLALGVCSDGFRHAAEAAGAAPLYGYAPVQLFALHSVLPFASSVISASASLVIVAALAGSASASLLVTTLLLPILLSIVRAYDSLKGPLPPALLTPIPTPAGDVSALVVLAWQSDALVFSAAIGVGLVSLNQIGAGIPVTLVLSVAALITLLLLFRRRLQYAR